MMRLHLKPFLERHHISAYQLARATRGRLSEATVYGMARKPLQRIDLDSVATVLDALQSLTGQPVTLLDLVERSGEAMNPKYAHLLRNARPLPAGHAERTAPAWSAEELAEDEQHWRDYREEQRTLQEEREGRVRP
ncbi:helix-turn-helix transcriptional regulator [Deinococcus sp. YIM 134068]|uniref:helix-turn-helix domain-containing protein n=1 Tax=Deinococcus lichenicola TaxID=3118910 RepID=UPI002F9557C9